MLTFLKDFEMNFKLTLQKGCATVKILPSVQDGPACVTEKYCLPFFLSLLARF